MNKQDFINLGGKEWTKDDMERVYISASIFNKLMGTALGDGNNKFFFDCKTKKLMRSYKGKKPVVEADYSAVEATAEVEHGDDQLATFEDKEETSAVETFTIDAKPADETVDDEVGSLRDFRIDVITAEEFNSEFERIKTVMLEADGAEFPGVTILGFIDHELREDMQPVIQRYTPQCVAEMVHLLPRSLVQAGQVSSIAVVFDSHTDASVFVATEDVMGVITLMQAEFELLPGSVASVILNLDDEKPDVSKYQKAFDEGRIFYGISIYEAACKLYDGELLDTCGPMMEAVRSVQVAPFSNGGIKDDHWISVAALAVDDSCVK